MADEMGTQGPKDTTPNPMDDMEKKAQPEAAAPAEGGAPAEAAAAKPPEPEGKPLIDEKGWSTILLYIMIVLGLFGLALGLRGQAVLPLPAALGSLLLALAGVYSGMTLGKFSKAAHQVQQIARYSLAGVFGAMTIVFLLELFKVLNWDMNRNKLMLLFCLILFAVVVTIEFILYIRANKDHVLADVYMFIAFALAFGGALVFYSYNVVPAFVMEAAAMILVIMSVNKSPYRKEDWRVQFTYLILLLFLAVFAYACTIFYYKGIGVTFYGKISPPYRTEPVNLTWSGDSWSFAFNVIDRKKNDNTVNIINSLTMGMTSLPPNRKMEASEAEAQMKSLIHLPKNLEKMEQAAVNLTKKKDKEAPEEEKDAETLKAEKDIAKAQAVLASKAAEKEVKLPKYVDAPVFNNKGNMLIFTAGESEKGPRQIWGVEMSINLLEQDEEVDKKEAEHEQDLLRRYGEEASLMILKEKAKAREEGYKKNMPVGKPKVLLADMNEIVDKKIEPITHKTAWSPDGKSFCFAAEDAKGVLNIYTSDIEKQEITQLTKGDRKMMPLWSPAGDKILYVSKTDSYTYLKVSDVDGSKAHEFSPAGRDRKLFPLWNSDQSKVIYYKKGKVIIMNANATEGKGLSRETLTPSPYWLTEDQKKVRLEYTESGNIWRIWTISPNGKNNKQIFEEVCESLTQPKWSYDGKAVVAGANYGKESSLWRLGKDGEFKTRMYTTKHQIRELEWSPTSERIAFVVEKKQVESSWYDAKLNYQELWVINNDGTQPMALYESVAIGGIKHISWNDRSTMIAFDETFNRLYFQPVLTNIRIVNAIGGERYDLLPYEFYSESPTWSNDGQVLAYIGWNDNLTRSFGANRVWAAQLK